MQRGRPKMPIIDHVTEWHGKKGRSSGVHIGRIIMHRENFMQYVIGKPLVRVFPENTDVKIYRRNDDARSMP
jgi:hypothetical protein